MALQGNGQLLIEVKGTESISSLALAPQFTLDGYAMEPLSAATQQLATFAAGVAPDKWLLAVNLQASLRDESPWDAAHRAAASKDYVHYVEPDVLHERPPTPSGSAVSAIAPLQGFDGNWPPPNNGRISAAWHLEGQFTGFASVRNRATGAGIRIAHLDTGYRPDHISKPRNLKPNLGYDYYENKNDAIDPGDKTALLANPGHGTATLAILAGNTLNLPFNGTSFQGDFGGAPDADVIPVRIGPSVVHFYTSTMAKGLYHALAPKGDSANQCHVVTISHGGLPSDAWASAVNVLYEAGIVIVAASGDSFSVTIASLPTRHTVYPSAFNRVVTAVGATYEKTPYITTKFGVMQGCWGPDSVMKKAIAGYTPNVAWMKYDSPPDGFTMNGSGTSASTPQVAAACALWLQINVNKLPADWRRAEACRLALFGSAGKIDGLDESKLGWGFVSASALLDTGLAQRVLEMVTGGSIEESPRDKVSLAFWRLLLGFGPPQSERERMYENEVAQVIHQSANEALRAAALDPSSAPMDADSPAKYRAMLLNEQISNSLRERLNAA